MKAIIRRLRRLEEAKVVRQQEEGPSVADLLRERRRRRAEVNGEPFEERPFEGLSYDLSGDLSVADILRSRFRRAKVPNECAPG